MPKRDPERENDTRSIATPDEEFWKGQSEGRRPVIRLLVVVLVVALMAVAVAVAVGSARGSDDGDASFARMPTLGM